MRAWVAAAARRQAAISKQPTPRSRCCPPPLPHAAEPIHAAAGPGGDAAQVRDGPHQRAQAAAAPPPDGRRDVPCRLQCCQGGQRARQGRAPRPRPPGDALGQRASAASKRRGARLLLSPPFFPPRTQQEGTIGDAMDVDEYSLLTLTMLGSGKSSAARDMAMTTWCASNIGRGDDARLVFLPDLIKPQLLRVLGEGAASWCRVGWTQGQPLHASGRRPTLLQPARPL